MNYILYGNLGAQIFMSVSMQLLWGMVNTLQLIIHMNMLSVIMPANVQLFFSLIVNIVQFKIVPTDKIISTLFGIKQEFKSKVSPEFQQTGYGTTNILKNLGLLLLAVIGVIALIGLVFLMRLGAKRFPIINKIQLMISRKLFFNSIIRGLLEAYMKFGISTWISTMALKIDEREDIINAWVTLFMAAFVLSLPFSIYIFLYKNQHRLQEEDFKGRFESLYLNVDTGVKDAIMTVALFVFRRLIYSINIVLFSGSTCTQLFAQFFCCLLMLLFFTGVKPMNQPFLNNMEIFNELTLLICSYFLFLFTDFVGDANTRFMIGWAFVGLAAFNILVNWCALLYKVGTAIRGVIRGLLHKRRIQKYLQEKQKRLEETAAQPLQMETVEATSPASPVKKRKLSKKMNINVKKGVQDGVSTDEAPTPNKKGQRQRTVSDNLEATIDKQKKISIDDQTPQHQRLPTNDEVLNFDGFETQQPPTINKATQEIGVSPVNQATPGLATSTTPVQIQNNEIPARSPKKKGKKSKKTNTLQKGEETPLDPQQDFMDQVAKAINHGIGFKPRPINYFDEPQQIEIKDIDDDEIEVQNKNNKSPVKVPINDVMAKINVAMKNNPLFRKNVGQKFFQQ
ncbi:hypothetical protein FGO68_gene14781 [Halteria grandinella]|uniref:Transmembrane protein n=1 Tax=Halteria grandinella TaxID=5974 RepID=A0A8J8P8D6_HALGN|nr:hypothetical protein FGO68_gene14781 [Halteria grandinella]